MAEGQQVAGNPLIDGRVRNPRRPREYVTTHTNEFPLPPSLMLVPIFDRQA